MKKLITILSLLALGFSVQGQKHKLKVTVAIVDEQGIPLVGVPVSTSLYSARASGWGVGDRDVVKGLTDKKGHCTLEGKTTWKPSIGGIVEHDGYYPGGGGWKTTGRSLLKNQWEPWNPTVRVVLKRKRNPIPMIHFYNRGDHFSVPKHEAGLGFDLEVGDWVAPHGAGVKTDIILTYNRKVNSIEDFRNIVTVSFPNPGDGIQEYEHVPDGSTYRWPFVPPDAGYMDELTFYKEAKKGPRGLIHYPSNFDAKLKHLLRVRTVLDSDGKVESACYAKMLGGIAVGWKPITRVQYWFNPNRTRNLENDPERDISLGRRK